MSDFDPARRLVMAKFKTVLGHSLPAGTPLAIVEEPKVSGEVDEAMARRLFNGRLAVYADDFQPTPVETPEQEKARIAAETVQRNEAAVVAAEAAGDEPPALEVPEDLNVTNAKLREIAAEEGVAVESDDNKADLQTKILAARAVRVEDASDPDAVVGVSGGAVATE